MDSRVMVVDDNPVNRRVLSTLLSREGYECLEAENGPRALELARQADPDVILLDVMMPGQDGYAVCRELKQDPQFEHTPVLFLSSLDAPRHKVQGFAAGGVDFVSKPFDAGEVLARVRHNLSSKRRAVRERNRMELLKESEARLRKSMESAAMAQAAILPAKDAAHPSMEFAWTRGGGQGIFPEMFSVQRLDQRHICAWMVDVGGRGFGQGIVATGIAHLLHPRPGGLLLPRCRDFNGHHAAAPEEVISKLDAALGLRSIDSFFSIHYLLLDTVSGILKYAGIGRPDALLLRSKGGPGEWLEGAIPPPGSGPWARFRRGEAQLEAGDRIYLLSDGVTLATGCREGRHQAFSEGRAEAILLALRAQDIDTCVASLGSSVMDHIKDCEEAQDWTVCGMEYLGNSPHPQAV